MTHILNKHLGAAIKPAAERVLIVNVSRRVSSRARRRGRAWSSPCSSCPSARPRRSSPTTPAAPTCRMAWSTTRTCSSPSTRPARSPSSPTARRWAPASRTSLPMVRRRRDGGRLGAGACQQAPGDEKKYGNQDTDGSRSMRHFVQPMRQMRRGDAHDAGAGGGEALGRAGRRGSAARTTRSCICRSPAAPGSVTATWPPRQPWRCRCRRVDQL